MVTATTHLTFNTIPSNTRKPKRKMAKRTQKTKYHQSNRIQCVPFCLSLDPNKFTPQTTHMNHLTSVVAV